MIKEVFGDRFLLASIVLFLIGTALFSYYIYDNSAIGLAFGGPLTDSQKSQAISIATADLFDNGQIWLLYNPNNKSYHVKEILPPSPFHEIGPKVERNGSLPAVEFVIGNDSETGANILAFVDLDAGRVAYIGFIKRADTDGNLPLEDYTNFSLFDTGYHAGDILTGEQRDKAVRIAMEETWYEEGAKNDIHYQVVGDITVGYASLFNGNDQYFGAYPVIVFREVASIYVASRTVYVTVDPDHGKVINNFEVINTPVQK